MGRRNQDISFYHSTGINNAISEFQANIAEALYAQNIYFKSYGQFGAFLKRKGRTRINAAAVSANAVRKIMPFTVSTTTYVHYYDDAGQINTLNMSTGDVATIEPGFSTSIIPDVAMLGDKHFISAPSNTGETDIVDLSVTANWSGTGIYDTELGYGTDPYGIVFYDADFAADGTGGATITNITETDFTAKLINFYLQYATDYNTTAIPADFEEDSNGYTLHVTLYSDSGTDNYKKYSLTTDVNNHLLTGANSANYYTSYDDLPDTNCIKISIDPERDTPSETGGTFDVTAFSGVKIEVESDATGALYLVGMTKESRVSDLLWAENNIGYHRVTDENAPEAPIALAQYDGRVWAASGNLLYYSTTGDGTDWTIDSSNFEIDDGDGDSIVGLTTLGQQLIVFKKHSVHRIMYTGNDVIPYRRISVYSGGVTEAGVGCASKETIKRIILESVEYVIFGTNQGIYALAETGNPIPVDNRVREDLAAIPENRRPYAFAVVHPEKRQYWFAYALSTNTYSDNQLIYGVEPKAWSKYTFSGITSATTYISSTKTFILMGDKNGLIYKHDYQTTDAANDWRDQNSDASYSAIDAYWQSHYLDFQLPARFKTAMELEVMLDPYYAGDVTWTITNENAETNTGTFDVTSGTSLAAWENHRVSTGLYGKFLSVKFRNATLAENMEIKFWSICLKPSGAA